MLRGCVARLIPILVIGALLLWFLRSPESVAGLIGSAIGLVTDMADSMGRFVTSMTPVIDGLL